MRPVHIRTFATVAVAAFALAACGSSSKSSTPAASDSSTTVAPATTTTVAPATTTTVAETTTVAGADANVKVGTTKLGKVLTDAKGMTLYRFDNDTTAGKSTCTTGVCAQTWPAATVTGDAVPGAGVDAAKLTTFTTPDGKTQLQIDGHPLYTFKGDTNAGDTNGQGILDKWYAAGPTGAKVGDKS